MDRMTTMKSNLFCLNKRGVIFLLPLVAMLLNGCSLFTTRNTTGLMDPPSGNPPNKASSVAKLHVGDTVTITLSGPPDEVFLPIEKPIKDDGTISLPGMTDVGSVKAAGKTPGELEDTIRALYVPRIYKHLNVTVKAGNERVYYVRGEVRRPDRFIYSSGITVSKAITSAGDFTDFADRTDVVLTRADGRRFELNLKRVLAGRDPDPPVFPGDQIEVGRRIF
jgi:polysaccharide biosynthesis/export protein VpsN